MTKVFAISVRVIVLLFLLISAGSAAEPRRISVYAPQAVYQVDILVREGVDYVGLTDLIDPLGRLESRVDGKKLKLTFNGAEADFQDGKRPYHVRSNKLELTSNFLLIDGRGYIPAASIAQLLPRLADQATDFHSTSRRLFIGSAQMHFSVDVRRAPSRVVLSFSAPVNPSTLIEKGRVRLLFRREPLVSSGADNVSYSDPFLQSTSFTESPAGAELVVNLLQPATVSLGDGGRTVTIAAAVPVAAPAAVPPPQAAASSAPSSAASSANQARPAPRPRPFVILDPAHGGFETGAILSPTLQEKNVTLALARRLQKELEARGIPVVLTRVADNLLTWDQRAISANTSHAALYVALHASAAGHGVRIYTSLIPSAAPSQGKPSFLPWETAQSPFLVQSSSAASAIAAECTSAGLPVRASAAPLRPLNSVTTAAVAVEISPLGSLADELAAPDYQQKVAAALASGIAALRGKLGDAQ